LQIHIISGIVSLVNMFVRECRAGVARQLFLTTHVCGRAKGIRDRAGISILWRMFSTSRLRSYELLLLVDLPYETQGPSDGADGRSV
jgi:hypothetical protein